MNVISRSSHFFFSYIGLTRLSLIWEYLWPALWPATAIAGLFIAAALFNVFTLMPLWLHVLILVATLIGFTSVLYRVFIQFPKIEAKQARHRLERDSGLSHRPLASLEDALAIGINDTQSQALWRVHQARMTAQSENLKLKLPKAGLSQRDPLGLRAAVSLILLTGIIAAGADGFSRIGQALSPSLDTATLASAAAITIWIIPPAYTQNPPVILRKGGPKKASAGQSTPESETTQSDPDPVRVPMGSEVHAQVTGGSDVPILRLGPLSLPFKRIETDNYHAETKMDPNRKGVTRLSVLQKGRNVASWSLSILEDQRPTVAFSDAPETSPQLGLRLPYEASDDYRLKSLAATIRRLDGEVMPDGSAEIILRMPLPGGDKRAVRGKSNNDLISHVWAGLPVLVNFLATDELDQIGISQVEPVILPQRQFSNPVAKELIEIRKGLSIRKRDRMLGILKLDSVAEELKQFDGHISVYLGLRVARERLLWDLENATVKTVQEMLWHMALGLEEGLASTAGNDLRTAQRRLQEALDRKARPEELERLLNEVEKALQAFMQSLMRELRQRGQISPQDPDAQSLSKHDMQRLIDRARELIRQGSPDAARQLMAELKQMLENLRGALSRSGGQSEQHRQAQRVLRDLRGLVQRQQQLLDKTHRRAQRERDQRYQERIERSTEGRTEQDAIRKQLGRMLLKFGNMMGQIPMGLGEAERAMKESAQALGQGYQGKSIGPQTRALESLIQGAQNSARALARRQGLGQQGFSRQGGRLGVFSGPRLRGMRPGNRDPFGRRIKEEDGASGTTTGRVKIPDESEIHRARRILEELRRRAGDLWRPEIEQDYIDRLLKRF